MFGKRCSLCGGKLVDNKCTLCGLDNSKSDANYKVNKSSCDGEPLTHVHVDEKEEKHEYRQTESKPPKHPKTKTAFQTKKNTKHVKKSGKGWIAVIVAIVLIVGTDGIGTMISGILDTVGEWTGEEFEPANEEDMIEYDDFQYEYVTRELSESGQEYDTDLGQGEYIVGVHLPEGTYTVEKVRGDFTYFSLDDYENLIYIGEDFSGEVGKIEDIRCYSGAKIRIEGGDDATLHFRSENAQNDAVESLENGLKEPVDVKDGYMAGTDFAAGTYDVVEEQNDNTGTEISYIVPGTIPENQEDEDYVPVTDRLWIDTIDEPFIYKNLYLPKGTKILIEGGESVHLEPSEVIAPSYTGYYYEYE